MPTLNLGIVAHVDAGKTTLTERLLYETGVTDHIGRVDHGDTITDTDDLERQRGITIRSAVVTFTVASTDGGETRVNLIDTPGHSDFVAEVERALAVLDGAVLVVSAVEGVQAQTRVLIRILERLGIPFLVFANKIDRIGADYERDHGRAPGGLDRRCGRADPAGRARDPSRDTWWPAQDPRSSTSSSSVFPSTTTGCSASTSTEHVRCPSRTPPRPSLNSPVAVGSIPSGSARRWVVSVSPTSSTP